MPGESLCEYETEFEPIKKVVAKTGISPRQFAFGSAKVSLTS